MNTRLTTATAAVAFALLGSSAAFAQEAGRVSAAAANPVSRAAVVAELAKARANGELGQIYGYGYTAPAFVSTLSRAEVKAQLLQARAEGKPNVAESYDFQQAGPEQGVVSTKSRAEVKAEVLAARQRGERFDIDDRS
ncbi:MAG: DUF4148 domain-containing protein [Pseudomonadota bacterium]